MVQQLRISEQGISCAWHTVFRRLWTGALRVSTLRAQMQQLTAGAAVKALEQAEPCTPCTSVGKMHHPSHLQIKSVAPNPSLERWISKIRCTRLCRSMHHPNRFVRETAHFTAATLCQALQGERLLSAGQDLAERLSDGLSDNWSQVCGCEWMCSCVCRCGETVVAQQGLFSCACPHGGFIPGIQLAGKVQAVH